MENRKNNRKCTSALISVRYFLYQNAVFFPDFALPPRVRDKNEHYMSWYPVTAYLCGRAMFFKELYYDRFVKISFYLLLEGIITSNLSVRCAS